MKKITNILFFSLLLTVMLGSCKKDEYKNYFESGTAPVLTTSAAAVKLSYATAAEEAVKLTWTNPNYTFTTGVSSQSVNYVLEIDTTGANFTNPNKKSISINQDLSLSISVAEFNDYLLNQLVLKPGMNHNLDVRVKASLASGTVPIYSNVLKLTATPYSIPPKVAVPSSGKLFLVGDASPGGWTNPVPVPSQEFVKVSETLYELTVPLSAGKSYLFLPVNGDWGFKYGAMGANNSNNPDGDDFKPNGGDMASPATSGTYKIVVDFQRGKFSVTKQ
ncbi:MAG: SusE domain-containing protein [Sediminibacterium sp.]|nr:SusE domain-containing protein [Sediminibacterium sp.]